MTLPIPVSRCLDASLPRVDEALRLATAGLAPVPEEDNVMLPRAAGRIAARDIVADAPMPPFARAAMDGFAFRSGSYSPLNLVGTARAGHPFIGQLGRNECVAIATGAPLPQGCDTVAMLENCSQEGDHVWLGAPLIPGTHVRRQGEDYIRGDALVTAGTRLAPRTIALLASAGHDRVAVRRKLRVAVFSCGDEFLTGSLNDSNRAMLMAALPGHDVSDLGILPSARGALEAALREAARTQDVIISSAGTSVGDDDHMRAAILGAGGQILVSGVAIRPGKPVTLGRIGQTLHIALPGNPVAAFVTFLALARPLLDHLSGARAPTQQPHAVRAGFSHAKKKGVREYLRVTLSAGDDGLPVAGKLSATGTAQLHALAGCDGLVVLDEDIGDVAPGQILPCLMPDCPC